MARRVGQGRLAPLVLSSLVSTINAISIPVQFNTARTYGHDGPWQAVTVHVGGLQNGQTPSSQWTTLDLYPGATYDSFVPSNVSCKTNTTGVCGAGGIWNPASGAEFVYFQPSTSNSGGNGISQSGNIQLQNLVIPSTACPGGGNCLIPNSSLVSLQYANVTLPNGRVIDLEIGNLALGASQQAQGFTTGSDVEGEDLIQAWNAPGYLYNQSTIQSDTFSLHIGAAQYQYPGSLIYGGFDQSRAIGPATSWSSSSNPQLLDITIDVETGGSPFNFSSAQTGLLISNTSQAGPLAVAPLAQAPYLGLPKQTCDNLARYLPIQFDTSSQYYLWNTEDPMYQKIIESPAYLGFAFPPPPGQSDNVVIKVPFMLLNLTLKTIASGRSGDVPYFPCVPFTPSGGSNVYTLGRAFLQSALYAGNFASGINWLAQAPGPGSTKNGLGSAPQIVDIAQGASTLDFVAQAGDNTFNSSWSTYWKPLDGGFNSNSSTNSTQSQTNVQKSKSGGLSTGAQAGIGVGVALGVLAVAAVGLFFFLRRRRAQGKNAAEGEPFVQQEAPPMSSAYAANNNHGAVAYPPDNKTASHPAQEMGHDGGVYDPAHPYKGAYAPQHSGYDMPATEMSATQDHHFELAGNEPVEMDAAQNHAASAEAPSLRSPR